MTHYDSTARVPFAKGGKVDKKPPKPKRIILWKGKAKDWPGAQKAKERTGKEHGGNVSSKKTKGYRKRKKGDPQSKLDIYLKNKKIQSQNKKKYIEKHGEPEARRKTLAVTDKYKKIRDSLGLKKGDQPETPVPQKLPKAQRRSGKKEGGKADKKWIQGVNKSIKARGTKGVCTGKKFGSASCKPGSRRYNLAKTFKKMARSKHASGGLVRFI